MKKFIVPLLVCALALNACGLLEQQQTPPTQVVDTMGTMNAIVSTSYAQTLTAQPSPTEVPATSTFTPTLVVAEASPTDVAPAVTDTPVPNLTTTPATATSGPGDTPSAPTAVPGGSGSPTPYPTTQILTYGTLPPENRPYTDITIVNASKTEAYISLQIVTDQGYTIIEYPVKQTVKILIPTGSYTYVVWVGGRQIIGYFQVPKDSDMTITIYRNRVEIK